MQLYPDTIKDLMFEALRIARLAGSRINEIYGSDYAVSYKQDNTPVTTADLEANRIIVDALENLAIGLPVLSEESDAIPYPVRNKWSRYWLVDPLDGTREFMRRNGEFSVNIALIEHGRPLLGVVTAPALDVSYFACHNQGVWKQLGTQAPESIQVRPIPDNTCDLTIARSRNPTVSKPLQAFLDKVGTHNEVPMGSSLKSCLVAEGVCDLYVRLGPTSEWDTGAAQCIVEQAGGYLTDTNLQELRYNTRESLLNPHFMVFGDRSHNWQAYLPGEGA